MSTQNNHSRKCRSDYRFVDSIAERLEERKRLLNVAVDFDDQCLEKYQGLFQSEFDIGNTCSQANVAHTCGGSDYGCVNKHVSDGNFFCKSHACPSQNSFDCSAFSCRGAAPGIGPDGNFNCAQSKSFACGGASFVCTRDHQCGGSESAQMNRSFACTNNVRCHTGNVGNNGFSCGGEESNSTFACGVSADGSMSNVFKCEYGFTCLNNAQFSCENRSIFTCRSTNGRSPFLCEKKNNVSTYACVEHIDCNLIGSFDCPPNGVNANSCTKDGVSHFNCFDARDYNNCVSRTTGKTVYTCTAAGSKYGD